MRAGLVPTPTRPVAFAVITGLVAVAIAAPARGQTCSAPARTGLNNWFPGAEQVLVAVNLPQFPVDYRNGIQLAVSQAAGTWNTIRANENKSWPELTSDPSVSNRHNIVFEAGLGSPVLDVTCPPSNTRFPAALTGPRAAGPGSPPIYETVIYGQHGCGGNEVTFSPESIFNDPDNLFNLFMHELGHALGAGHSDCASGIMNGNGNQLFDGVRKTLAHEECETIDAFNDEYRVGGSIAGLAPGELIELGLDVSFQGELRSDSLLRLQPGEFSFHERAPNRSSYLVRVASISNSDKQCTVSGASGTIDSQDAMGVGVACTCFGSPSSPGVGEQDCDDPLLNEPLGPIYRQGPAPLCQRVPRACSGPTYFWWWLLPGPPGTPGGAPCQRETDCTSGPVECYDLDGNGTAESCSETLHCTDRCVGGASITLRGPHLHLTSEADGGRIRVSGWALDPDGVSTLAFFVDEQPVTLEEFEYGLYRPEACTTAHAPGGPACNRYGGFEGTLDVGQLAPGPHRLQLVAADDAPELVTPSAVEHPITVAAPCGDTMRPEVAISAPAPQATVSGTVPVSVDATDDVGVVRVAYYVDGVRRHVDFAPPFEYSWETAADADGPHALQVRAYDACDNWRYSSFLPVTVDNAGPTLQLALDAPAAGATVSGPMARVTGWAYDPAGVAAVTVEIDGGEVPVAYGISRPGVCQALGVPDPVCPIGFEAVFDSREYANGLHGVRLTAAAAGGAERSIPPAGSPARPFQVANSLEPCAAGAGTLCLRQGRFEIEVDFADGGTVQSAAARPHDDRNALYWFYHQQNLEVGVKLLGPDAAGWFWLFHGGLTDREYTVRARDTETGQLNVYAKAAGSHCGGADLRAFPAITAPVGITDLAVPPRTFLEVAGAPGPPAAAGQACVPGSHDLCLLGGRFRVEVVRAGAPQPAVPLTDRTGAFWFGSAGNLELIVKVLDGTPVNGRFWVFYGALTDRDYTVRVTDTVTGATRLYVNPLGNYCGVADTSAF